MHLYIYAMYIVIYLDYMYTVGDNTTDMNI